MNAPMGNEKGMKQLKKFTRNQKEYLSAHGLDWKEWGLVREDGSFLSIANRTTGERKEIEKTKRKRRI